MLTWSGGSCLKEGYKGGEDEAREEEKEEEEENEEERKREAKSEVRKRDRLARKGIGKREIERRKVGYRTN